VESEWLRDPYGALERVIPPEAQECLGIGRPEVNRNAVLGLSLRQTGATIRVSSAPWVRSNPRWRQSTGVHLPSAEYVMTEAV
jgi:hypothetical protein